MVGEATALKILLVKPFAELRSYCYSPLLGLLYLTSALRRRFGSAVTVRIIDAKLEHRRADDLRDDLAWADVVGLSALNAEMEAAFEVARLTKALKPEALVVLGGPCTHRQAETMLLRCAEIDWVFDGEAERSFPAAIASYLAGEAADGTIPGMYFRDKGGIVAPDGNDVPQDLDALPWPAWDQVDFDAYARAQNMNTWMRGRRYAALFTSRGCPYRCSYCHDSFAKTFRSRSAEDVVAEISLLIERHGVDEFQIFDDIFNLDRSRVERIFALLKARYPHRRLFFCFPNGLRADLLDRHVIRVLKEAGAYQVTIAIESVTPRLQELTRKRLDLEKTYRVIDECWQEGIFVKAFFMLGFPTETPHEIWDTLRFALRSRITFAHFFTVVPQPGTPLYDLARIEGPAALESSDGAYHASESCWYQRAYGYPLRTVVTLVTVVFHLHPRRLLGVVRGMGLRGLIRNVSQVLAWIVGGNPLDAWRSRRIRPRRQDIPAPAAEHRVLSEVRSSF